MNSVHTFVIDIKNPIKQIEKAIDIYKERFGRKPKKVFVNPALRVEEREIDGVPIVESERVKPAHHVWLGDKLPKARVKKNESQSETDKGTGRNSPGSIQA